MPTAPSASPAIRTIAMPADTNPAGDIFGGWLMSQMDLAAGNLAALATRGRICIIGVGAGARTEINLQALMGKRGRIHGSVLRARSLEEKADAARRVERAVLPGFASGDLSVPVAATFPLDAVADAYARFKAGAKLGKIVLEF